MRQGFYTCLSVILFTGGVSVIHPPRQTPPCQCMLGYTPTAQCMLGYIPPVQCMLGYGQLAGGPHPTGMHTCINVLKAYNHQKGTRIFILKRNRINVMFMGYSLFLSKRILKYSASNVLQGNSDNFLSETKIYNKTELFITEATIAVLMILHQRVFVTLCSNNTEIWQVFIYLFHLHSTILQKSTVDKWWFSHKLYPFGHIMFPIFLGKTNWNK